MLGITTLLSILPALSPLPAQAPEGAPPGLVPIKGGRVEVGTDVKQAVEMIKANPDAGPFLAGETPQHRIEVEDFYLMVTEVTNEQYAEFVRSEGAKPPHLWGRKALDEARVAHLEEQGLLRRAAAERGERHTVVKFEDKDWWDKNWESAQWEVPQELLAHPVTYVDYKDATAYAKWAGLRLMTEFEYYRAARGDSDHLFPWGDEWKEGYASTLEGHVDNTSPVGSFPDGAVDGVYDLVGNVWEWTDSPYVGFKGYDPVKVKMDRNRTIEAMAHFEPSYRVLVSGSFRNDKNAVRVSTRMGSQRSQATEGVGFRCAASTIPGADSAAAILRDDIALRVLSDDVDFFPEGTIVASAWKASEGTARDVQQYSGGRRTKGKLENYAVIEKYDQVLFVPVVKTSGGSVKDLTDLTLKEGPVPFGFLSTTIPLAEPALEPGTYFVAWRGGGKARGDQDEEGVDWTDVPGFDQEQDQFVFMDLEAAPLVASSAPPMLHDRIRRKGSIQLEPFVPPTDEELKKLERAGEEPPKPLDTIRLKLVVPGKNKSKGFLLDLPLLTEPSVVPEQWHPN